MEDNKKLFESLIDRATDYGRTSFELVKLKAVDKASDVVSSVVPHVFCFNLSFIIRPFLKSGAGFMAG